MINQLVKVTESIIGDEKVNSVDARELHEFLEVGRDFSNWIKGRIEKYDFQENEDYIVLANSGEAQPRTSQVVCGNRIEYALSLEMAKELSMVENNDKGKEARKYFIACEKKQKQSPLDIQMTLVKFATEILNVSEVSKLQMVHKVFEINNVSTDILPQYVNTKVTFSLTELLKKNNSNIGTKAFNSLLIAGEYLVERERASKSQGIKKFKMLTDKGLKYGTNDTSPLNPREIQPHYFEDTFKELYTAVIGE